MSLIVPSPLVLSCASQSTLPLVPYCDLDWLRLESVTYYSVWVASNSFKNPMGIKLGGNCKPLGSRGGGDEMKD